MFYFISHHLYVFSIIENVKIYFNNKFHIAAINFRLELDRDRYYMKMHSYKKYNTNTFVIIMELACWIWANSFPYVQRQSLLVK